MFFVKGKTQSIFKNTDFKTNAVNAYFWSGNFGQLGARSSVTVLKPHVLP